MPVKLTGGEGMAGMMKMMADKKKDSACDSLFMGELEGMIGAFGGGDPMKGGQGLLNVPDHLKQGFMAIRRRPFFL